MNFSDYQRGAAATAVYPNIGDNLAYPILGLANEAGELAEKVAEWLSGPPAVGQSDTLAAEIASEAGDVLWYAAQTATELGLDLGDLAVATGEPRQRDTVVVAVLRLVATTGIVAGIYKKVIRDDDGVLNEVTRGKLSGKLSQTLADLAAVAAEVGTSLEQVGRANHDKLASRAHRGVLTGSGDHR